MFTQVEYEIKACKESENGDCVDAKRTKVVIPKGGEIVYGVAHQHSAGIGAALYGQVRIHLSGCLTSVLYTLY